MYISKTQYFLCLQILIPLIYVDEFIHKNNEKKLNGPDFLTEGSLISVLLQGKQKQIPKFHKIHYLGMYTWDCANMEFETT